jgi:hypothetical protein
MLSPGILEFIWQHREDDPRQMALSGKKYPGLPMAELASQVQALQKIRHKIPSWYRPGMYFPFPLSVEQASSEATAKFKAGLFEVDKMADLTGGMGVDAGFFAQKAQSLTYVEQNAALLEATRHNFQTLGIAGVDWYQGTAESFLATHPGGLDLIYLDPARRHDAKGKVFQLADCTPDVLQLKTLLFQKARRVLLHRGNVGKYCTCWNPTLLPGKTCRFKLYTCRRVVWQFLLSTGRRNRRRWPYCRRRCNICTSPTRRS